MLDHIEYEKQLQEENMQLRNKLAEATTILEDRKKLLEEKVKKYGDNKAAAMWEPEKMENTWEIFKNLSQKTPNFGKK
jgi:3-phenylpropionate/cinnamic acid dioxygenase small subunit